MNIETVSSIFTIGAFYLAGLGFIWDQLKRKADLKSKKKDILESIRTELELMNSWLGKSYTELNYKIEQEPLHTFHMIYSLGHNTAIKSIVSDMPATLLSESLLKSLVVLNQKLGSFEQHIDRLTKFCTADPILSTKAFYYYDSQFKGHNQVYKWARIEALARLLSQAKTIKPEEIYLIGVMRQFKDLHVIGIGDEQQPTSLRYSFISTYKLVINELNNLNTDKRFETPLLAKMVGIVILILTLVCIFYYSRSKFPNKNHKRGSHFIVQHFDKR